MECEQAHAKDALKIKKLEIGIYGEVRYCANINTANNSPHWDKFFLDPKVRVAAINICNNPPSSLNVISQAQCGPFWRREAGQ